MSTPNDTPLSFMAGAHSFKIPNLTVNGGNDNRKDYRTTNTEFMIHNNNQYTGGAKHYNPMTFGGNSKGATTSHHADPFGEREPSAARPTSFNSNGVPKPQSSGVQEPSRTPSRTARLLTEDTSRPAGRSASGDTAGPLPAEQIVFQFLQSVIRMLLCFFFGLPFVAPAKPKGRALQEDSGSEPAPALMGSAHRAETGPAMRHNLSNLNHPMTSDLPTL